MPMIHLRFHLCNRLFLVWSTLGRRGETAFNRIGGLLLAAALAPAAHAATCTSNGAGINWNTAANWTCAPAPVNKVPAAADIVIINSNMTVNANTANLASVTINNGFTLTQSRDLNMTGALNVAGILNSSDTMFIGGPTTISGPSPATAALNIVTTGGNHTFAGLVTIDADGTWNNSANETVVFRGGIAFNGDAFNAGTAVQTFNTNAQSISGTLSIPRVTVTGVTLANNGNLTVSTALTGSGTFANGTGPASTATLTLGMQTVGITNLTAGVNGNSVIYNRTGDQTIERPAGSTYHHLVLDGSGTKTVPGGTIAINGNMTIDAGVTYNGTTNDPDIDLAGNFSNNGTFNAGTGVFTFVGGMPQALGGTAATTFEELTIGKSAGNVTISCGTPSPAVDNGTLTLAGGKIITSGTSASSCSAACSDQVPLIIGLAGTIDGGSSASYVQGALRNVYGAGFNLGWLPAGFPEFPIGDAIHYTPVDIEAGTTSTAGTVTACVTPADHPQVTSLVPTTGIDAAKSVNRYWSLTTTAINTGAALVNAIFTFVPSDVDSDAATGNFVVEDWNGTLWDPTTRISAGATSTQVQNIDLTDGVNEFAIGEPLSGVTALPGNFNAFDTTTTAGAVIGLIQTKQSGVGFTLRLVRLNATETAIDTTYNRTADIVELLDASDNTGALNAATACRPIGAAAGQWKVIAGTTQAIAFVNGIASVTFPAAVLGNSYRDVRVHIRKIANPGIGEGCSTDRFALRPQSLTVSAHDATWETAGATRILGNVSAAGGNVHKASTLAAAAPRPFTIRARPVPATATNYDGVPTTVTGFPSCGTPLGVALCNASGALGIAAGSWSAAGGGVMENGTANYSEAGAFNLQLEDVAYAGVDAVDNTPAATRTVPSTATVQIGRFVPDHFVVAPNNIPQYRTFNALDAACAGAAPKRTFGYIGQSFGWVTPPQALITAQNATNQTTVNYAGTLWKVGASDVTENYPAAPFDASAKGTPAVTVLGSGTGLSWSDTGGTFSYARTTPQASFTANISLTVSVEDASEDVASQGVIGTTSAAVFNGGGPGIAFDGGGAVNGAEFRYGRLRILNGYGSNLLPLPVAVMAQHWTGSAYAANTADNCTSIAPGNFALSAGTGGTINTSIIGGNTLSAGRGSITLSKPTGFTTKGSVRVDSTVPYLMPGVTGLETFGIYKNGPMIYLREMY